MNGIVGGDLPFQAALLKGMTCDLEVGHAVEVLGLDTRIDSGKIGCITQVNGAEGVPKMYNVQVYLRSHDRTNPVPAYHDPEDIDETHEVLTDLPRQSVRACITHNSNVDLQTVRFYFFQGWSGIF